MNVPGHDKPFPMSTKANYYVFAIRPHNYPTMLLAWQTKPVETFIFKGKEISYEELVTMLDHAEVPRIPKEEHPEKPVNNLLVDVKALYADVIARFSGGPDEQNYMIWPSVVIKSRLSEIIEKYR
jgi:hypothetical protein